MGATVNICIGHQPFPASHARHVDIFLTRHQVQGQYRVIFVDEAIYSGVLGEYAQLFWLNDHFDKVVGDASFVRIFHYRRFVSRDRVGWDADVGYYTRIPVAELVQFADDFTRDTDAELFMRPIQFPGGMLSQFAAHHPLEDLLAVVRFLLKRELITYAWAVAFLREEYMMPACSVGVFRTQTLYGVLKQLRPVADFLQSPEYVAREGYNQRILAYILERLESFILLEMMRNGQAPQNFGNHIIISESPTHTITIDI
jgi:hypothetical protein